MRARDEEREPVDDRHCQAGGAQYAGDGEVPVAPVARTEIGERRHDGREHQRRQQRDCGQVQRQAQALRAPRELYVRRYPAADGPLQRAPPPVHQVIADMRAPRAPLALGLARSRARVIATTSVVCEVDRAARNFHFVTGAAARHILDDVAIAIARGEVLQPMHRIFAQRLLDQAVGLDEGLPVGRTDMAQAADAVGDGDLMCRGRAAGGLQQLRRAHPLFQQLIVDPALGQHHCRTLRLQPPVELVNKGRGETQLAVGVGVDELGQELDELLRPALCRRQDALCPVGRRFAFLARLRDARGDATQVLQQSQAQHDGKGPQLAQAQRGLALIGIDEVRRVVAVDATVLVRDQLQRQRIDARITAQHAFRQAR